MAVTGRTIFSPRYRLLPVILLAILFARSSIAQSQEPREAEGVLAIFEVDYLDHSETLFKLILPNGQTVKLEVDDSAMHGLRPGDSLRVAGNALTNSAEDTIAVSEVQKIETAAHAATVPEDGIAAISGIRNMAVFRVNFLDSPVDPLNCSTAQLRNLYWNGAFSVKGFFEEVSDGAFSFNPDPDGDGLADVFDVSIPYRVSDGLCTAGAWGSAALSAATAAGIDIGLYVHRVFILGGGTACTWAGLANMSCTSNCEAYVNGLQCALGDVPSHEIGHNLGLGHAGAVDGIDNICSGVYADRSCMMGCAGAVAGGWRQFNAPHQEQLGWIAPERILEIAASGTYNLAPLEQDAGNATSLPQLLKIPIPSTTNYLYLSYRVRAGTYSTNLASLYRHHTSIHRRLDIFNTNLVGLVGDSQSYIDAANGITVTQLSSSISGATLNVTLSVPPATPTPTATRTPTRTPTPSLTPTRTPGPTITPTPTATSPGAATSTPAPLGTRTPVPASTATPDSIPTITASATAIPTAVPPHQDSASGVTLNVLRLGNRHFFKAALINRRRLAGAELVLLRQRAVQRGHRTLPYKAIKRGKTDYSGVIVFKIRTARLGPGNFKASYGAIESAIYPYSIEGTPLTPFSLDLQVADRAGHPAFTAVLSGVDPIFTFKEKAALYARSALATNSRWRKIGSAKFDSSGKASFRRLKTAPGSQYKVSFAQISSRAVQSPF